MVLHKTILSDSCSRIDCLVRIPMMLNMMLFCFNIPFNMDNTPIRLTASFWKFL